MRITLDEIKYLLRNSQQLLEHNMARIKELYDVMEEEDTLEEMLSIKTNSFGVEIRTGTGGNKQDLGDVLEKIQSMQRAKVLDIRAELSELSVQNDKINRLLICYQSLAYKNIKGYTIVKKIYVENNTYESVEIETKVSHKTFENTRKKAIDFIKFWFESECSNTSIITAVRKTSYKNRRCEVQSISDKI